MLIKQGENISQIKEGLKQVFDHNFSMNVGQREIIKMKNADVITDRDLDISKFLFKFKFATAEQIHNYLDIIKDKEEKMSSINNIINRLNKLVQYRVLNKFMLTDGITAEKILPEALQIYCLDLGGRYLLANYSNEDTSDWYSIVNMKGSGIINKNLCVTEFYIALMRTIPDRVVYFNPEPDIRIGKSNIVPFFDMCLNNSGNKSYFVGEVVREYDFPIHFRERAYKLESLFESNGWKKYYYDSPTPPVLFLFADTDITAFEVSKMLTETTETRRFRLTTDERMKRPLYEAGAFLRYSEEDEVLQEIKATTFLP